MNKAAIHSILNGLMAYRDGLLIEKRNTPAMSVEAILIITAISRIDESRHLLSELLGR